MSRWREGYSELLDAALFEAGRPSQQRMAERLDGTADLNQTQIYRWLTDARGGVVSSAQRFDLACAVIAATPRLLDAVAARAGCVVVPIEQAGADVEASAMKATADALRTSGDVVTRFLEHIKDGKVTNAELREFTALIRADMGTNQRLLEIEKLIHGGEADGRIVSMRSIGC